MPDIREANDFKNPEMQRLEEMVSQRTNELQEELRINREMNERLSESNKRLNAFLQISRKITTTIDQRELMQEIVDNATSIVNIESGALYMKMDSETISLAATVPALPEDLPVQFRSALINDHPHIHQVLTSNHYVLIEDCETAELTPAEREIVQKRNLCTILYLPISLWEHVIGVLILGTTHERHQFTGEEIALLQGFAHQAAQVNENIRNYEQTKEYAKKLEREITERKQVEEELIKQKEKAEIGERKLKEALEIGKLGGWELDIKTGIFTFTDSFYKIFHTTVEKMGGYQMTIAEYAHRFVHPEDAFQVAEENKKAIESNDPGFSRSLEHRIVYDDGGVGYISVRFFVVKDEAGNTIKTYGVNQDITEKKIAEVELIKAKEKAEESDRLKSAFLANMSHEIRTPMSGILGFAALLKEADLTGIEKQRYVEIIEKSGRRLLNIINDIVDISKIEAGLMELHLSESNINDQIDFIYDFFKPEATAKGLRLSVKKMPGRQEAILTTDREKLYAILTNLVKNSIKYTDIGEIEIGCLQKGDFLEFYVNDTGIGIPKYRQKAIFERFIQADIDDKMALQGAGLGLSISKAYVEMLGGEIRVESEEGKGSTFYFTLPVKPIQDEKKYPYQQDLKS